jgi:site-specific DNA-methyltransferase (adenine-specific)
MNRIINLNCSLGLRELDDKIIDTCVTSPPYWGLRDYGNNDQIGHEDTLDEYLDSLVKVFREVKRVLKDEGTLWLNIGDCYYTQPAGNKKPSEEFQTRQGWADSHGQYGENKKYKKIEGLKYKNLIGIPFRLAFKMQDDGWFLRSDIIWSKPNPVPESVRDRPTKSHEYIFLFSKKPKYYYNKDIIMENAISENYEKKNKRSVWNVPVKPFKDAHFATFPEELITPCILAGSKENGIVLDPFMGSGTTAVVAKKNNRQYIGFELNQDYIEIANKRLDNIEIQK